MRILQDTFLQVRYRERRTGEGAGKLIQVRAVLLEDPLEVVNPERAFGTLERGVRSANASGLGLLFVAP